MTGIKALLLAQFCFQSQQGHMFQAARIYLLLSTNHKLGSSSPQPLPLTQQLLPSSTRHGEFFGLYSFKSQPAPCCI